MVCVLHHTIGSLTEHCRTHGPSQHWRRGWRWLSQRGCCLMTCCLGFCQCQRLHSVPRVTTHSRRQRELVYSCWHGELPVPSEFSQHHTVCNWVWTTEALFTGEKDPSSVDHSSKKTGRTNHVKRDNQKSVANFRDVEILQSDGLAGIPGNESMYGNVASIPGLHLPPRIRATFEPCAKLREKAWDRG